MGQDIRKRIFHITMLVLIIFTILMVAGMTILRYEVEGESSMPFSISKIIIVSTAEGENKDVENQYKWNFDISQNNDIYIGIDKEKKKNELIKSIIIENMKVKEQPKVGEIKFFKPNTQGGTVLKNAEENQIKEKIEYEGDTQTDIKELKIGNTGGTILFRTANVNVGTYNSNNEEITHDGKIFKYMEDITANKLKYAISFDMTVNLTTDKSYRASINIELPVGNIIKEGVCSIEKTDFSDVIFKRI